MHLLTTGGWAALHSPYDLFVSSLGDACEWWIEQKAHSVVTHIQIGSMEKPIQLWCDSNIIHYSNGYNHHFDTTASQCSKLSEISIFNWNGKSFSKGNKGFAEANLNSETLSEDILLSIRRRKNFSNIFGERRKEMPVFLLYTFISTAPGVLRGVG